MSLNSIFGKNDITFCQECNSMFNQLINNHYNNNNNYSNNNYSNNNCNCFTCRDNLNNTILHKIVANMIPEDNKILKKYILNLPTKTKNNIKKIINSENEAGETIVYLCASNENYELIDFFKTNFGANPKQITSRGFLIVTDDEEESDNETNNSINGLTTIYCPSELQKIHRFFNSEISNSVMSALQRNSNNSNNIINTMQQNSNNENSNNIISILKQNNDNEEEYASNNSINSKSFIIFKGGENNNFIRGVRSLVEEDDSAESSDDDNFSIGGVDISNLLSQKSEEQHLKLLKKIESFLEKKKIVINGFTIKNNEKNIRILKRFIYRKTRDENPQLNSRETMDNILKNDSNELIEIFNNINNYEELENLDDEILEKQNTKNQEKYQEKNTKIKEKEQQNQNNKSE